jgi:hypothetical protein
MVLIHRTAISEISGGRSSRYGAAAAADAVTERNRSGRRSGTVAIVLSSQANRGLQEQSYRDRNSPVK